MGVSFKTPNTAEQALASSFDRSRRSAGTTRLRNGARRPSRSLRPPACRTDIIESWHYTDLRAILREALPPAPVPDAALVAEARERLKAHALPGAVRLVVLDGCFSPDLSDLSGLGPHVRVYAVLEALSSDGLDADLRTRRSLAPRNRFSLSMPRSCRAAC